MLRNVQEARLRVWTNSDYYKLWRNCGQRLRRLKRAKEDSLDEPRQGEEQEITPAPLTDWREIPLEALERKELREALRTAVAELPATRKSTIALQADKKASFGVIIKVMDALKLAGVKNLPAFTQPQK